MRRRAFTLLEAVVALAIGVVVLSALYAAVARGAAARERATAHAERLGSARSVLLRMATELEAAVGSDDPAAPERFVVVAPSEQGAISSELRFATADATLVSYRVDPPNDRPGRLVRRAASRFRAPDSPEPDPIGAVDGVGRFRVRCFDGRAWRAGWAQPGLPRAVELALALDDGAGASEELTTTVAIPTAEP